MSGCLVPLKPGWETSYWTKNPSWLYRLPSVSAAHSRSANYERRVYPQIDFSRRVDRNDRDCNVWLWKEKNGDARRAIEMWREKIMTFVRLEDAFIRSNLTFVLWACVRWELNKLWAAYITLYRLTNQIRASFYSGYQIMPNYGTHTPDMSSGSKSTPDTRIFALFLNFNQWICLHLLSRQLCSSWSHIGCSLQSALSSQGTNQRVVLRAVLNHRIILIYLNNCYLKIPKMHYKN